MKTKITLFLGVAALVTLSFTFANVDTKDYNQPENVKGTNTSTPVGGLVADEVVK